MKDGKDCRTIRFGPFEADLETAELSRAGAKLALQIQPFQVLAFFLQHPGDLVTREQLRSAIWPQDTFVDFDHALNTAITKIRVALGDNAERPTFIETLPRRGYRFIGIVQAPDINAPAADDAKVIPGQRKALWIVVGAALLLCAAVTGARLVLLSGIASWRADRKRAESLQPSLEVVPLVVLPGGQAYPVFSPDGNQVAFEEFEGEAGPEIYTTLIDGAKPLRLAKGDSPTWSPDGRQIAFYDNSGPSASIDVVSALGGPEHRLYTYHNSVRPSLSWSPDGKILAFSEGDEASGWIMLLSLADSATRRLSSPPHHGVDLLAAFSPDGSALAFVRAENGAGISFVSDLFVVPTTGGEPKRLTFDKCPISGISWTPDGRDIVFSSFRGGLSSLWRISASGGTPRPLAGVGVNASYPSISPKGNQLAYQQMVSNESIWRVDLKDDTHRQEPPALVISGKETARLPHFSPDGKRITFDSNRSGHSEIWACDSDGSNCEQVTSLHGWATNARWSPDSRYAAFEFHPQEHSEIGVVEIAGGLPRLIPTFPGSDNGGPSWSRDGQWIYFHSNRGSGAFQLWKVPVGGGPPVQVTRNTGLYGVESADGRSVYYLKTPMPGIWKLPLSGGEETRVLDQPPNWWHWELARNGIYFISYGEKGPPKATLKFFEFATHKITSIRTLEKLPGAGLTLAADGKSILYVQNEFQQSSIMLVKNFR